MSTTTNPLLTPSFCPVFRPTWNEFEDFKYYIKTIEKDIWKYGIVKIIPPLSWNPKHEKNCNFGVGNLDKVCKDLQQQYETNNNNKKNITHKNKRRKMNDCPKLNCDESGQFGNGNVFKTYRVPVNYDSRKYGTNSIRNYTPNHSFDFISQDTLHDIDCMCQNNKLFSTNIKCPCLLNKNKYNSDSDSGDMVMSDNNNNNIISKLRLNNNNIIKDKLVKNIIDNFLTNHINSILLSFEYIYSNKWYYLKKNITNNIIYCYMSLDRMWYKTRLEKINKKNNSIELSLLHTLDNKIYNNKYNKYGNVILLHKNDMMLCSYNINNISNNNRISRRKQRTKLNRNYCCNKSLKDFEIKKRIKKISNLDFINWNRATLNNNYENNNECNNNSEYESEEEKEIKGYYKTQLSVNEDYILFENIFKKRTGKYYDYNEMKLKNISDIIIESPVLQVFDRRQHNVMQPGTASGYMIVQKNSCSVLEFWKDSRVSLENEIREYVRHRDILRIIDSDKIEENLHLIEQNLNKNLSYFRTVYGADTTGSIMHESQVWCLNNLGTILNLMNFDMLGVTTPYLYFGRWRTIFAWHIEDTSLYSINYLHFGKPKIWYGVPYSECNKLEEKFKQWFPQSYNSCKEFTRHKTSYASPYKLKKNGVQVYTAVQRANEIMITCPKSYHAGFNLGFNCAEAVNFATPMWLPVGLMTPSCKCGDLSNPVNININNIINNIKISNPNLMYEIPKITYKYINNNNNNNNNNKNNRKRSFIAITGNIKVLEPNKKRRTLKTEKKT